MTNKQTEHWEGNKEVKTDFQVTEKESLAPVLTCRTGGSTEAADPSNM